MVLRTKIERIPIELIDERENVKKLFDLKYNTEAYRRMAKLSTLGREKIVKKRKLDTAWGWLD